MCTSADVATVRKRLEAILDTRDVNVDLRKMQVWITTNRVIDASILRKVLDNTDFEMSGLTTSVGTPPSGVRDDEVELPGTPI